MAAGSDILLASVRKATEGEYTVEGELGRGGMAAVYLARDIALDRPVAIKVMLPDLVDVAGIADRFLIEARAAARLDHPGIVTVYSVKKRDDLLFIVMKCIAGRTLESVLKDEREIPMSVATAIIGQVAEALQFAHAEGVVHRDVKPSNVLIDVRGRPVIADFGIAKVTAATSITMTGALIGTPAYMSPEQCRGLPATAASDQYALGVMAYEMFARRLPFTGSLFELIHAHCDATPEPLAELCPGLDPVVRDAVMRMLAKNPRDRWPSLADVARAFSHRMAHGRESTEIRADIAAMAREALPDLPGERRKAIAYDLSGQATEQVTTPAPGLVITPQEPAIEIGATVALRVSESSGASLAGVRIQWRSEDASIATVDSTGVVTGVSVGLAKITASGGAALGRATVTVKSTAVDTLVVTPQNPDIEADSELQLVVSALDARGNMMARQHVVWVSSDVAICAVSQTGRVIGVAPGRATLTAQVGDVTGSATIRVRPQEVMRVAVNPGELSIESDEKRQVSANVVGPMERTLRGRTVRWRSSIPAVATVTDEGIIEGLEPGTAAIIAACDGKEGFCSVIVRSQPVVAVRIQPARLHLEVGRALQLEGVAEDRRGRVVPGRGLEWHSDDTHVALVDTSGKVHAAAIGHTTVRATANGVTSSIDVVVVPRPVAQVVIGPHEPSLAVGTRVRFDATPFDADGASLTGRPVQWTSSDAAIASIDAHGHFEARKPGSVRVTVTCEQARSATKLKITAAPKPTGPVLDAAPSAGVTERESVSVTAARVSPPVASTPSGVRRRPMAVVAVVLLIAGAAGVTYMLGRNSGPADAGAAPGATSGGGRVRPDSGVSAPISVGVTPRAVAPSAPRLSAPATSAPATAQNTPGRGPDSGGLKKIPTQSGPAQNSAPILPQAPAKAALAPPPAGIAQRTDTVAAPTGRGIPVAGGGGVADPVVTAPPLAPPLAPPPRANPLSVSAAPGVSANPAGKPSPVPAATTASEAARSAERALLCDNPSVAVSAINGQLASDPAKQLLALYMPRDAADRASLDALGALLKDTQRLRASARAVRNEASGDRCEWVMALDLNWTNAFGQPRRRALQLRTELELLAGAARIKRIFGASGL